MQKGDITRCAWPALDCVLLRLTWVSDLRDNSALLVAVGRGQAELEESLYMWLQLVNCGLSEVTVKALEEKGIFSLFPVQKQVGGLLSAVEVRSRRTAC